MDRHLSGLQIAILNAIPAEDYELRNRVTKFFEGMRVLTLKHTVDDMMMQTDRWPANELKLYIMRSQKDEVAAEVENYMTQEWRRDRIDGIILHELTTSIVVFKERDGYGR